MAVVIDSTLAGENSNSYVSLSEANTYFESSLYSQVWDEQTDDMKNRALVSATNRLDRESYYGDRSSSTQKLAFPRIGLGYLDGKYLDNIIPSQLKMAVCETAKFMLENDITKKDVNTGDIKSLKFGSIGIDYVNNSNVSVQSSNTLTDYVVSLLDGLSRTSINGGMVHVGR